MAAFTDITFTNEGLELHAKAQIGTLLNFTHYIIGDGYLPRNVDPHELNNVINPVVSVEITKKRKIDELGHIVLEGSFQNSDVSKEFYYRELALFAEDPDNEGQSILYAYGNAGSKAEFIPSVSEQLVNKVIKLDVIVGNAPNVKINVAMGIYATREELKEEVAKLYRFTGTANNLEDLLDRIENGEYFPKRNDVWNILHGGGFDESGYSINDGDNIAYSGTGWDKLGSDLSNYYTKPEVNGKINELISDKILPRIETLESKEDGTGEIKIPLINGALQGNGGISGVCRISRVGKTIYPLFSCVLPIDGAGQNYFILPQGLRGLGNQVVSTNSGTTFSRAIFRENGTIGIYKQVGATWAATLRHDITTPVMAVDPYPNIINIGDGSQASIDQNINLMSKGKIKEEGGSFRYGESGLTLSQTDPVGTIDVKDYLNFTGYGLSGTFNGRIATMPIDSVPFNEMEIYFSSLIQTISSTTSSLLMIAFCSDNEIICALSVTQSGGMRLNLKDTEATRHLDAVVTPGNMSVFEIKTDEDNKLTCYCDGKQARGQTPAHGVITDIYNPFNVEINNIKIIVGSQLPTKCPEIRVQPLLLQRDNTYKFPVMTSNNTPTGFYAAADSNWDGSDTYSAFRAFSGLNATGWASFATAFTNNEGDVSLYRNAEKPVILQSYSFNAGAGNTDKYKTPYNFTIEGSNDDSVAQWGNKEWTVIDNRAEVGNVGESGHLYEFECKNNTDAYKYYRMRIKSIDPMPPNSSQYVTVVNLKYSCIIPE